jgi:hypothetical protein
MALVVAFFVVLVGLVHLGWRNRKRRQSGIPAPHSAPQTSELGATIGTFEGQYVATTRAGDPLDRIVVGGLGFRAHVFIVVTERGIVLGIPGSDAFIPAGDLRTHGTATWTIDRAVEEGGLRLLAWDLGGVAVESYFRMNEPEAFEHAIDRLLALERKTS